MSSIPEISNKRVILVTFGSITNSQPAPELSYQTKEHGEYKAYLTTEAGVRFVQMCEENRPLRLYCFASDSFLSCAYTRVGSEENRSVVDDIKALRRTNPADLFEFVSVADDLTRDNQLAQLQEMQKRLKLSKDDKIYIDMTGGKRDAAMMMISLVRFLQFQDIQPEMILYSDKSNSKQNIATIVNTTHLATVFNLFSAMDIFLKTGAAGNLRQSIMDAADKGWAIPKPLDDVLRALESFSDKIALCQAGRFQDAIAQIRFALDAYHPQNCIYPESLFAMLVERVRDEFASITGAPEDLIATERWLLNHGLVQQALTLYTDQMPGTIYGESGCVIATESEKENKKSYTTARYDCLVNDVCGAATPLCCNRLRGYRLRVKNGQHYLVEVPDIPPEAKLTAEQIKRLETFMTIAYQPDNTLIRVDDGKRIVDPVVLEKIQRTLGIELRNDETNRIDTNEQKEYQYMSRPALDPHVKLLCRMLDLPEVSNKSTQSKRSTLSKVLDLIEENQFYFGNGAVDDFYRLALIRDRKKCCLVLLDYVLMKMLRNSTNHGNGESALTVEDVHRLKKIAPDYYIMRDGVDQEVKPADVTEAMRKALKNLEDCLATPKLKNN